MAAYIVFTRESTRDASELETYSQNVGPTLAGHPVTVLAAYGRQEVLEGPEVEGVVILEFPSFDEAGLPRGARASVPRRRLPRRDCRGRVMNLREDADKIRPICD